jgi:hypothetical protein
MFVFTLTLEHREISVTQLAALFTFPFLVFVFNPALLSLFIHLDCSMHTLQFSLPTIHYGSSIFTGISLFFSSPHY